MNCSAPNNRTAENYHSLLTAPGTELLTKKHCTLRATMNFKSWLMSHVTSESFYLYILYSWSYTNTAFCMNGESWGHNAVAYAFLCSSLLAGRVLGGVMYKAEGSFRLGVTKHNLNGAFLMMAVLHMGVAIITRYSVLIFLYFMIGLTASRIGASQNDGYKGSGRHQSHNSIFAASEVETEVHSKRKITMFMFSTLLSSLLYNTADASISFPAFYSCSFFSVLILAILLLNTISDRSLLRRICGYFTCRKTVIPRFSQIGESKSGFECLSNTAPQKGM